jgi:EmrB/QacA subfamily drug resistance transporter
METHGSLNPPAAPGATDLGAAGAAGAAGPGAGAAAGGRLWVVAAVAIAAFLTTIDSTIVNVALPAIQRDLRMSLPGLQWVVTAYLLMFAALMLGGGQLADRYGSRRVLLSGLAVFTAASLSAGTARSAAVLLASRAVQGAGAALVLPAALALVAAGRTARERDTGAAVWMAALAAALATGPVAGGWLSQHLGWHWIFLVNVPLGLAGLAAATMAVRDSPRGRAAAVDAAGLACSATALGAVTFALTEGPGLGWHSPAVLAAVGLACAAAAWFGRAERRSPAPMIDFALVRERVLAGGMAASVLWGAGVNGILFFTSLFLQRAAGFSATRTGLVFLPVAVLVVLVAPLTPALAERLGPARTVAAGLVLVAAGLAAVALATRQVSFLRLLPGMISIGAGSALTVPLTTSVLAAVPAERAGVAGGLLGVAREASGLVGISVIGLIVAGGRAVPPHGALPAGFAGGYGLGLLAAAALVALGAVIAGRTLPGPARR